MEKFGMFHKELYGQKVSFICDSIQLEFITGSLKNRLLLECMDSGGAHWKVKKNFQSNLIGDRWANLKLPSADVVVGEIVELWVKYSSIVIGLCNGVKTTFIGREYTEQDLIDECLENCDECLDNCHE